MPHRIPDFDEESEGVPFRREGIEGRGEGVLLKIQLLEIWRLKALIGDHLLMSVSFAERERELVGRIAALAMGNKETGRII